MIASYDAGWFYFVDYTHTTDRFLYRCHGDGSGLSLVSKEWPLGIAIQGGYIYYARRLLVSDGWDSEKALWRMAVDGSGVTKLFDRFPGTLSTAGGFLYYSNGESTSPVMKDHYCRVDLSDPTYTEQELTLGIPSTLSFAGEKIFTSFDYDAHFGWSNLDLTGSRMLVG